MNSLNLFTRFYGQAIEPVVQFNRSKKEEYGLSRLP